MFAGDRWVDPCGSPYRLAATLALWVAVTAGLSACGGGGGGDTAVPLNPAPSGDTTPPSAPPTLSASAASADSLQLSWTASTDNVAVTGYRVYRDGALVATVTGTQLTVTGLAPATRYRFHVVAIDAADNPSAPSAAVTATTAAPASPGPQALVDYDFPRGDSLAAKSGWAFASTSWGLTPTGDGAGLGLPFSYAGVLPGGYATSEMRFTMPPQDAFWLRLRLHVPANYAHRHDTELQIANAAAAGWQVGDRVRGTDGVSEGVISRVGASHVFLRFAARSAINAVWVGTLTNTTRGSTLASTGRMQWPTNNKLLAIWTDDYSAHGKGPTIIWSTELDWSGSRASRDSYLTVAHTIGGNTVSGAAAVGTVPLIAAADVGKAVDIVFHGRFSSRAGAKDGVIQTFVRKQGQANYTMVHNITNADLDKRSDVPAPLQPWRAGYLMGWANSGYDQATTFHISRIEVFAQPPAELAGVTP